MQWEFMVQLSAHPDNVVIGIVRDKPTTDKKLAEHLPGRSNITILQADIGDYEALKVSQCDWRATAAQVLR
jgi:hypothetical protein